MISATAGVPNFANLSQPSTSLIYFLCAFAKSKNAMTHPRVAQACKGVILSRLLSSMKRWRSRVKVPASHPSEEQSRHVLKDATQVPTCSQYCPALKCPLDFSQHYLIFPFLHFFIKHLHATKSSNKSHMISQFR